MTKARPSAACASESLPAALVSPAAQENDDDAKHEPWIVLSESALFEVEPDTHCDACGEPLPAGDGESGYGLCGSGVYLSLRGDDVRLDTAPLCSSCAAAIGVTALARWEIEEEEG